MFRTKTAGIIRILIVLLALPIVLLSVFIVLRFLLYKPIILSSSVRLLSIPEREYMNVTGAGTLCSEELAVKMMNEIAFSPKLIASNMHPFCQQFNIKNKAIFYICSASECFEQLLVLEKDPQVYELLINITDTKTSDLAFTPESYGINPRSNNNGIYLKYSWWEKPTRYFKVTPNW